MGRRWRVWHAGPLAGAGLELELSPEEGHHVQRVLRLRSGARVGVFDGCGAEWNAVVESCTPDRVSVRLEEPLVGRVDPAMELRLYTGLCRADRMDWLIQKAVEVGVSAVHPLHTARAEAYPITEKRLDRWRRIALEAAKQSGRRHVPPVEAVERLPPADEAPTLGLALDLADSAVPLASLAALRPGRVRLVVGPEAGLAPEEVDEWCRRGWRRVGLGPRCLRAETAAVVGAALVLHIWDDLGSV